MTIAEARELSAEGIDFQLHTHRHRVSRDKALLAREIADNRKWLKDVRPSPATHFCYPSGVYRPEFPDWLKDWDVASAVTTEAGMASARDNVRLLPRLLDSSIITEMEFAAWLCGLADFLPQRRVPAAPGQFLEDSVPTMANYS